MDNLNKFIKKHSIQLVFLQEWRTHTTPQCTINKTAITGCTAISSNNRTAIVCNNTIYNNTNNINIKLNEKLQHYMTAMRISFKNNFNLIAISYYRSNAQTTNYKKQFDDLFNNILTFKVVKGT